jgi:DNA-binding Lrp family transcriptional regulator
MKELDRTDCDIIRLLQKNARMSNKELARRVNLAESSSLERVRRLSDDGVFSGFHAEVDPRAVGVGLQAIIAVRLSKHSRSSVDRFRREILEQPEVVTLYHVGGGNDYMLHVAVRDPEHLRDLALNTFTTRPEVEHIETSLVFEHVRSHDWPVYAGE